MKNVVIKDTATVFHHTVRTIFSPEMGQAESSKEFLADKQLKENHRPVNCFPPGSAGNGIQVSSPGKRNMAKSEDTMEIKSKLRRISKVDGEETPDIFGGCALSNNRLSKIAGIAKNFNHYSVY